MSEIPNKPFAFIWFAIKPYKKWFFWGIFFVLISDLATGLMSLTFKGFVDSANSYTVQTGSLHMVFLWIMAYPLLLLIASIAIRSNGFMFNFLTVHVRTRVIQVLFEYLSLHSVSYFNDRFSGALSEKVTTVSSNVSSLMYQFVWNILDLLFTYTVTAALLFSANRSLGWLFTVGFFLLIPINYFLTRKQLVLTRKLVELRSKLRGYIIDVVTNITAVQQYSRRMYEIDRLSHSITEYREADVISDNFQERILLINNILIAIFIGTIVLWDFRIWSAGVMTVGTLVMVVTLTRGFMRDLTFIGQNLSRVTEMYGEVRSGLEDIARPHDIVDKLAAGKLLVRDGKIVFDSFTFHYDKDPRNIFENLSFRIKNGQKVGIVGTSGAGKTTLMKLLMRQYDVNSGQILIDDQDISEVTQESLRQNISIVPQEPMLFHRTIRENIMYGKLDATEEEMIEVAKKAQAHDFIEALPNKYDSLVGERGVKLSVGQRQRIAIARAFLKNAPILILDEATSALDSESEVAVQSALQNLMEGKTVLAIAHRLSTLREMDRILVFKGGQIVEDGSHRKLLQNKEGVYASLWSHQAGGFIKEE